MPALHSARATRESILPLLDCCCWNAVGSRGRRRRRLLLTVGRQRAGCTKSRELHWRLVDCRHAPVLECLQRLGRWPIPFAPASFDLMQDVPGRGVWLGAVHALLEAHRPAAHPPSRGGVWGGHTGQV